ncbi:MAG: hypothetical protein AAGA68_04345 [Pseudomonadota bacterium]
MKREQIQLLLSFLTAAMLAGIAALHGSGFFYASSTIAKCDLPDFLQRVLPALWLYPSALMVILASVVLLTLRRLSGRSLVLRMIAVIVAANAVLGFVLGGWVPGGVLVLVAGLVWALAMLTHA